MTRKDEFLRAIQRADPHHLYDARLTFGWALNLKEKTIPRDIPLAARHFIQKISSPSWLEGKKQKL